MSFINLSNVNKAIKKVNSCKLNKEETRELVWYLNRSIEG